MTTADGRIIAVPTMALVRTFYWYQDAWDAAGLTGEDVPQSFTELLDFLDKWVQRIEGHPEMYVCANNQYRLSSRKEKYDYIYWLVTTLMTFNELQQRHAGEPVTFATPQFIELAERCRRTGLALYEAEPGIEERENMLQLFQNCLSGGEHANGGLAYGLSHSLPLRLTNDQPELALMDMEVHVIRKDSRG